jgi:glycosyltransferase involved in cell wall biosynthesis
MQPFPRMVSEVPLKIDIVCHGRFHSFALTKALLDAGHDVVLYTNYPSSIVARWGVPKQNVRSFITHGIATRVVRQLMNGRFGAVTEPFFHQWFGKWAASSVRNDADLVYGFSGVMEELLSVPQKDTNRQLRIVCRGSAHIRVQARLLEEEELRVGNRLSGPSDWMIAREEREYALADLIGVLSHFAYDSFVDSGVPKSRLRLNPLGVEVALFRPLIESVIERERRILSGRPLRVLTVGSFSYQKGAYDLVKIAGELRSYMSFCVVGDYPSETLKLRRNAGNSILFLNRVPEADLVRQYNQADLFLFPTIQDGFAAVLAQAAAAGLPIVATSNCSAPDFLVNGQTGWILPIRNPDAFIRRLLWCHENRAAFAQIARRTYKTFVGRDWSAMADVLTKLAITNSRQPLYHLDRQYVLVRGLP